jgi:hypothetical protein
MVYPCGCGKYRCAVGRSSVKCDGDIFVTGGYPGTRPWIQKKKKKKKKKKQFYKKFEKKKLISMIIVKPVYESQEHHILYQTFHAQQNERTKQEGTTAQAASPRLNEMNTEIGAI